MMRRTLILSGLAVLPGQALAQSGATTSFDIDLSAGVEVDSNVSVAELESTTGADDVATRLRAEFDFEAEWPSETEIKLGYTVSDKTYQDFSNFDLQTHLLSAGVKQDLGDFDVGVDYRYLDASLGGDGYLSMHQIAPYASGFIAKKVFARAEYIHSEKTFDTSPGRDATVQAASLDVFYFQDGTRRYFVLGGDLETNDATDDAFDFDAIGLKARMTQRIDIAGRDLELKIGWRYEGRDYSGVTPSIGEPRDDDRHKFQASLEYPINDTFYVAAEYEYADFSSNLPSADYSQNVFGLRLGARF